MIYEIIKMKIEREIVQRPIDNCIFGLPNNLILLISRYLFFTLYCLKLLINYFQINMFFDCILLNPQHRGVFGEVWLAATRGVNCLTKARILGVDVVKIWFVLICTLTIHLKSKLTLYIF